MEEIEGSGYNLNISRYVSTAAAEEIVDLAEVKKDLYNMENTNNEAKSMHNQFLKELGLPRLP